MTVTIIQDFANILKQLCGAKNILIWLMFSILNLLISMEFEL